MKKRIKVLFIIFGLLASVLMADLVFAQGFGVEELGTGIENSLSSGEDIRVTAGRLIQFALSFLGILAVLFIMYAGFLWMTSGGDQTKISKAKMLLKNAIIGLVIILSSWGITTFILRSLSEVLDSSQRNDISSRSVPLYSSAAAAIGNCSIENVYPADRQKELPRNTSILVSFKEELDLSNACVNNSGSVCSCDSSDCNKINPAIFRIFKTELADACSSSSCPQVNTNIVDVILSATSDKKTLVLMPQSYLGSSSGYVDYGFKISSELKKINGSSIFSGCSVNHLETSFNVSNVLDLTPPIVQRGRIFPLPDNERDLTGIYSSAKAAEAELEIIKCPQIYSPARVLSVSPIGAEISLDYKGDVSRFKVVVPAEGATKAQLFNAENNSLLGITDWNTEKQAVFPGYFSIKVDNYEVGSIWEIVVKPETLADSLRINNSVYTFSSSSVNNNIKVVDNCNSSSAQDLESQAANIQAIISGNSEVEASINKNKIKLKAKTLGSNGNNIALKSIGSSFVNIKSFSGGEDMITLSEARDKIDRPRNSAIQLTFNEPINPITVSGSASEVSEFIRIVNLDKNSSPAGAVCSVNSDCRSYKCDNSVCVGDVLDGRFIVSNNYRTVEFLSNDECGLNACGDKIYCLPANSNLRVELFAANLKPCSNNSDCSSLSPFSSCLPSDLGYNTCQNPDRKNYPLANASRLDGIVDVSINSFDGNRSSFSSGPLDFYYENNNDSKKKDNYSWSFFVSDEIDLTPPKISYIKPSQGESKVLPSQDIEIKFNKLMLNSTLMTGSVNIFNGQETFNHKLINLRSSSPSPFGFWTSSENIDSEPFDGEPDLTVTYLKHTPLAPSTTFFVQVGSGVKDITQNCYKPSAGPGCLETDASCCFGNPTSNLNSSGNCDF